MNHDSKGTLHRLVSVMRLINADHLLERLACFNDRENGNFDFLCGIDTAREIIETEPTVQVVHVQLKEKE